MTTHLNRRSSLLLPFILFSIVIILPLGCSKKSEPTSRITPAEAKTPAETKAPPPPPPTTGTVEGRMLGQKSHKPIADQLVVLCQIAKEPACNLRAKLKAITDAEGKFIIKDVAPGRYIATYAKFSKRVEAKLKDGTLIDPSGGFMEVVQGAIGINDLTFEFRNRKVVACEVRAGETTRAKIEAWGL